MKKKAAENNVSVSEIVRSAVEANLNETKKQATKKENVGKWLQGLAKEAKRMKVKGPKDLATNMDKYLYDKDFR